MGVREQKFPQGSGVIRAPLSTITCWTGRACVFLWDGPGCARREAEAAATDGQRRRFARLSETTFSVFPSGPRRPFAPPDEDLCRSHRTVGSEPGTGPGAGCSPVPVLGALSSRGFRCAVRPVGLCGYLEGVREIACAVRCVLWNIALRPRQRILPPHQARRIAYYLYPDRAVCKHEYPRVLGKCEAKESEI